ncbi:MAG TPA: alpha/beta fold hydrolase [Terriglobales bacterium]
MSGTVNIDIKTVSEERDGVPVRGFLHTPGDPCGDGLVLTHGAGANCQSRLLTALADAFAHVGIVVLRCDLPFRQLRPHGPPPRGSAERDQQGLRAAIAMLKEHAPKSIFLGGHSYGGRQASMLVASEPELAEALLLLSYPLHPPKRREDLRTAHFPSLRTPALFVSGTRDGFGSTEELTSALRLIAARTELLPIQAAGHELLTSKNREHLPAMIVKAFLEFTTRSLSR